VSMLWAYDYDLEQGMMRNERVFADCSNRPGRPDGSCVDAEGCLWNAEYGGGRVVRYPLDGSDGFTAAPDGTALKTKTSWQGVALVTDTRASDKGRSYHAREVRTMDASGHVVIETTVDTPVGKRSVTATLTKREG